MSITLPFVQAVKNIEEHLELYFIARANKHYGEILVKSHHSDALWSYWYDDPIFGDRKYKEEYKQSDVAPYIMSLDDSLAYYRQFTAETELRMRDLSDAIDICVLQFPDLFAAWLANPAFDRLPAKERNIPTLQGRIRAWLRYTDKKARDSGVEHWKYDMTEAAKKVQKARDDRHTQQQIWLNKHEPWLLYDKGEKDYFFNIAKGEDIAIAPLAIEPPPTEQPEQAVVLLDAALDTNDLQLVEAALREELQTPPTALAELPKKTRLDVIRQQNKEYKRRRRQEAAQRGNILVPYKPNNRSIKKLRLMYSAPRPQEELRPIKRPVDNEPIVVKRPINNDPIYLLEEPQNITQTDFERVMYGIYGPEWPDYV